MTVLRLVQGGGDGVPVLPAQEPADEHIPGQHGDNRKFRIGSRQFQQLKKKPGERQSAHQPAAGQIKFRKFNVTSAFIDKQRGNIGIDNPDYRRTVFFVVFFQQRRHNLVGLVRRLGTTSDHGCNINVDHAVFPGGRDGTAEPVEFFEFIRLGPDPDLDLVHRAVF